MPKTITIVTLYREDLTEHYVGVVKGKISQEDREELGKQFKLKGDEGDGPDMLFFCETEICESVAQLKQLRNIQTDGEVSG